jgi:DNA polymerase-1
MKIALLDSDIAVYRAAILCQDESEADAIDLFDRIQESWMDAARCDLAVSCLTTGKSFRVDAWPEYKANRADKPRPVHLDAVKSHAASTNCLMHPRWEADDIMGFIHSGKPCGHEFETVLVTVDKDMDQVPGWHCNPDKELLYEVSPEDAEMYRWMQVLSGDGTDNYSGIPGIGEKKARKLLEDVPNDELEKTVRAIYLDKGQTEEYCNAMIVCSTIVQYTEEIECALLSQALSEESTLVRFLRSLRPPHFYRVGAGK